MKTVKLSLFVLLSIFSIYSFAQDISNKPHKPRIEACAGKAENDSCSFTGMKGHHREGKCLKGPKGNVACIPTPPKKAVDACLGKAEKDACSFALPKGKTINGSCRTLPRQNVIACVPQRLADKLDKKQGTQNPATAPVK